MANNLDSVITWKEACERFENEVLPIVQEHYEKDGRIDECARSEAWNNWTDALCKGREISDWQYANWTHPACCS
jgi:hypothetical protein|tara:strand:- start:654 stop:875 length:222 start_codon:yes stop_codon:yes gene_type:complete